ncbi:hypothetical protein KIH31_01075 [Paenarthrobacter sp. DKR-5]|uniref:hypothetical protein n=1 Tax=Paenarthrobacter sp. DKR-5 TaxID=2835535 RepID=UPI001BDC3A1F|nr:hypothetical protein [Paenarthrobacter sp. DKR-5]MBT1001179.1 hypothetical protein [Paenarthrobacter sp. DKR-5]
MTQITPWPATLLELAKIAKQREERPTATLAALETELGPCPMPPEGYTLAPGSSTRWVGPETTNRGWIITPVWDFTTNSHSIEVWMAGHQPPSYASLSPADALELVADLAAAARVIAALA